MSIGCCLYRFHQHSVLLDRDYWVAPTIPPHFQYHTLKLVIMTYSITVLLHFQCTALLNLSICYTSVCNCRSNTITLMKTWNKVENLVKKTTWIMKQIYRLNIYIYIQRITMCPHGYHHSGSMATVYIYIYIQRITIYTKILEVNLFAFAYRLFRRDFSPLDGTYCMGTHSFLQPYIHFLLIWEGFMNGQSWSLLLQFSVLIS